MAGVLDGGGPPPAPNPQPDTPSTSQGVLSAPQIAPAGPPGALSGGGAAQTPAASPAPAPTFGQTLAALRHFGTIRRELQRLSRDPALGKSSVKRQIVDGMAELVANRIFTPGDAVAELAEVPERPFDQKTWVHQTLAGIDQAQAQVLAHYRQGVMGVSPELIDRHGDPDEHLADMEALMSQYKARKS